MGLLSLITGTVVVAVAVAVIVAVLVSAESQQRPIIQQRPIQVQRRSQGRNRGRNRNRNQAFSQQELLYLYYLTQEEDHEAYGANFTEALSGVCSNSYNSVAPVGEDEFHSFIQHLVEVFKGQRSAGKHQFAVLFLSPNHYQSISRQNTEFLTRESTMWGSSYETWTNNQYPSYPYDNNRIRNYITARPNGQDHAEALLMKRFHALMRAYQMYSGQSQCQSILLYTWLFPCDRCKKKIVHTLKRYTSSHQVILVYTTNLTGHDTNAEDLVSAGIMVKYETYDKYLPPA